MIKGSFSHDAAPFMLTKCIHCKTSFSIHLLAHVVVAAAVVVVVVAVAATAVGGVPTFDLYNPDKKK